MGVLYVREYFYEHRDLPIVVISGGEVLIRNVRSAPDLLTTVRYETGEDWLAICKDAATGEFFILTPARWERSSRNSLTTGGNLAIYGDYSKYIGKPLHDLLYESNCGKDIFFVNTKNAAAEKPASV